MIMSMCITFDTVSLLQRIYLKEIIIDLHKDACRRMFNEALSLIAKKKVPKFLSVAKRLHK